MEIPPQGPRFKTLADWLAWQQTLHPQGIALGLDRIAAVWKHLGPRRLPCPVMTVGGTNGKGSCGAFAEAIYLAAGYRVGIYSSPHLLRYNERVRINGVEVNDQALCEAFARVDAARSNVPLTYFELGTLAALDLFVGAALDLVILEVGLGGRLDAVNLIDPDVAVVTMIGRDHTAWLGDDLNAIAREKAGIFRAGRPAIIGQPDAPPALRGAAEALGCKTLQLGREIHWEHSEDGQVWRWRGLDGRCLALPAPLMRGRYQYDNAAAALAAIDCLQGRLPVSTAAIRQGLQRARLAGRFQVLPGHPTWILDVAHNAAAAQALAENLRETSCFGCRHAVMALLADKEPDAIAEPLLDLVDVWHLAETRDPRAMPTADLVATLSQRYPDAVLRAYRTIDEALAVAAQTSAAQDTILALGSFTTIEAALRFLQVPGDP